MPKSWHGVEIEIATRAGYERGYGDALPGGAGSILTDLREHNLKVLTELKTLQPCSVCGGRGMHHVKEYSCHPGGLLLGPCHACRNTGIEPEVCAEVSPLTCTGCAGTGKFNVLGQILPCKQCGGTGQNER